MPRRAAKKDANHDEVVMEFERHECAVYSTAGIGDGFPDIVVWDGEAHHLVEVKNAGGKLTDHQKRFMDVWPGPVHIVRTPIEVMALVQEWRKKDV